MEFKLANRKQPRLVKTLFFRPSATNGDIHTMTLLMSFNAHQRENSETQAFLESVGRAVNTSFPLMKASKTALYSRLKSWSQSFAVARRRATPISC